MQADVLYKGLEALSYSICQEVHYDLLLQASGTTSSEHQRLAAT